MIVTFINTLNSTLFTLRWYDHAIFHILQKYIRIYYNHFVFISTLNLHVSIKMEETARIGVPMLQTP